MAGAADARRGASLRPRSPAAMSGAPLTFSTPHPTPPPRRRAETTKDGLFTLKEVECLGACANAPMIQVNDDFYECLTPETTIQVLEAYKAGKPIAMTKWGSKPMNGQLSCEGPMGKTSLKSVQEGPVPTRELAPKVDPASVKKHMMY